MAPSLDVVRIRKLIWAYFFLLIFEGALRKWVLPFLATPLLIVRDPIVIAAYFLALRAGLFPRNYFMVFGLPLAVFTFAVGAWAPSNTVSVALFGFRANFLHLPLIFLIPRVFTLKDVRHMGRWTLWLAVPLALLMVVQFRSAPESWINSGAEQNFKQIESTMGRIRAPATFSFISGPVHYFAMVAAFVFWSQFDRRQYPTWLVVAGAGALFSASVVSGSRALIVSAGLVFACASASAAVLRPWLVFRWLWGLCLAGVLLYGLSSMSFFQEGLEVLNARVEGASNAEASTGGLAGRFLSTFTDALPAFFEVPLGGHGLGLGTNAGAALLTGEVKYLLAENEWSRIVMESGPLLGGAFLFWRVCLAATLGWQAMRHSAAGNPLPLLLFGACAVLLTSGQLGQNTSMGFTVLLSGLCLAAMRTGEETAARRSSSAPAWQPRRAPGSLAPEEAGVAAAASAATALSAPPRSIG